jgi:hypothetical protein
MLKPALLPFVLLASALLSLALPACHKADDDPNTVEITLASPVEGQTYQGAVNIVATMVGEDDLHGWELHIRPKAGGADFFTAESHEHGEAQAINESWTPVVSGKVEVELEIIVQLDHEDTSTATKKISFFVEP